MEQFRHHNRVQVEHATDGFATHDFQRYAEEFQGKGTFDLERFPGKIGNDGCKHDLIMRQVNYVAQKYPHDNVTIFFLDDRKDILNRIIEKWDPESMPRNVSLRVGKFDYMGVIWNEIATAYEDWSFLMFAKLCGAQF